MFDDRAIRVECYPTVVERGLQAFLDLPLTVFQLAEDFRPHGRPVVPEALTDDLPLADSPVEKGSSAAPGIDVSDRFARLLETGADHLAAAKAAFVAQNRSAAVQARELTAFAALRPADLLDRPDDEVGAAAAASRAARPAALTTVSEWAVDEVMATFGLPSRTAGLLLSESVTLVELLPATLAALDAGVISWAHVRVMVDLVAPLSDELRPGVEAALMAKAPGRTAAQLRETARRAVLRADASAATKRLARAIRDRSVRMYSDRDGMAALTALMSAPVTRACYRRLDALAEACKVPGDERTKDQRMTDCLADLLLGRGSADQPSVQVTLTVVASAGTLLGGDEPGEIDGEPVSALQIREMAYALGLLPRPVAECTPADVPAHAQDEAAPAPADTADTRPTADDKRTGAATRSATEAPDENRDSPFAASVRRSGPDEPRTSPSEQAMADLAALLRLRTTAGTALADLPRIAAVDEISGELRALTDAFEVRRMATCHRRACRSGHRPCTHPPAGPGLGSPGPTDGYEPSAPLDRFVRHRDRRCLFPGCRARPIRCDLDHVVPWPAGPTSAHNLCCLCRHHHRLSHQAPGWQMRRLRDGGIEWTLPGGERLVTRPIPFGTDDLPPPADPPPATPTLVDDDPPPF